MDVKENLDRLKKLRSLHSDIAKMILFEKQCIREKKRKTAKSDEETLHTSETNPISGHQPTTTNQDIIMKEDLATSTVLVPVNPDAVIVNANLQSTIVIKEEPRITASVDTDTVTVNANVQSTIVIKEEPTITDEPQTDSDDTDTVTVNANVQSTIVIKEEPTITDEPQTDSDDTDTVTVNANMQSTIVIKEEPTITEEPQTASVDTDTFTVNANVESTIVIKEEPTIPVEPQTVSASMAIDRPKRSPKKIGYRDKLNLAFRLSQLPRNKLGKVVRILRNREIFVRMLDPDNIEIDLQDLKTSTLRELIRYVNMCD